MLFRGGHCLQVCLVWLSLILVTCSATESFSAVELERNSSGQPDSLISRIQIASDRVHSFHCSFLQEKRMALFELPVKFEGELYVQRPDKLRWQFHAPVPSALLFNGNRGVKCGDQMAAVHFDLQSDPVMKSVAEQLWLWLSGSYNDLGDLYDLQQTEALTLTVTPKAEAVLKFIQTVTVHFDESTLQPTEVEIREPDGDLTRLKFFGYSLNPPITDTVFLDCGGNH